MSRVEKRDTARSADRPNRSSPHKFQNADRCQSAPCGNVNTRTHVNKTSRSTGERLGPLPGWPSPENPPLVMGVLNVTPDSFSDGGRWQDPGAALDHALRMFADGADVVDVGGESTRPGSRPVSAGEELERVIPVIEGLRARIDAPVSIDTSKPEVMRAAIGAGACMINDVRALRVPGALAAAAELGVPVCLMHMQGDPPTMQAAPGYRDVVAEVMEFLQARAEACREAGLAPEKIVLDPGFGFGKTLRHNCALFQALPRFCALGYPVLVGLSRKSMLGAITGREVGERIAASVAGAVLAARYGASILRVHDVAETVDALKVLAALTPKAADGATIGV